MPISKLPFELLSRIADFLLFNDKASCTLVCKRWTTPFQESLWLSFNAKSIGRVTDLCYIVINLTRKFPGIIIGQTLNLTGHTTLTNWLQADVFRAFVNLRNLSITSIYLEDTDMDLPKYSGPSESLTSLRLGVLTLPWTTSTPMLIKFLSRFPNLKEIDIFPNSSRGAINFDMDNFNAIYKAVPKLKHIKARVSLTDIHQNAVKIIPSTIPACFVTSLDLEIVNRNNVWLYYLWLCYFSYKYKNLRTLKWMASCNSDESNIEQYIEKKGLLLPSITTVLPHLETVEFCTADRSEWSHTAFWDFICQPGSRIKNLKYKAMHRIHNESYPKTVISQLVPFFSKTLKTLSMEGDISFDIDNTIRPEFCFCPQLVNIEIKNCGVSIALDSLLNNCTALRQLKYCSGILYIDPGAHGTTMQHGLQRLELENVTTSVPVFNYMSFRCRRLKLMKITHSKIYGTMSEETRVMCIDMSYTNLELLEFEFVQFYSSSERIEENAAVNLVLLSQLIDPLPQMETMDSGNVTSIIDHIGWFHLFCEQDFAFDYTPKTRKLSEQEICTTLDYYKGVSSTEATDMQEEDAYFDEQTFKESWKKDLCRGYAELRCGNILKYSVPLFYSK
ncbi:hypothetical protein J3Q64DRAFT_1822619, partial [Phycomyces blakesleeanus]